MSVRLVGELVTCCLFSFCLSYVRVETDQCWSGSGSGTTADAESVPGGRTVDEYFEVERPLLLPKEPFETGRVFTPWVDRYSRIAVRTTATRCRSG
ncbi:hypothetical protein G5C60_09190 [Streptomyces sp. HC44]|uniref:Uncharacterized protein n=1 Tax=Streptomyces scabichelini TaxID=2711217 RepID=A0A6G4V1L8_9ACTN|nr:hypothetical protein [Streptomyces scabichelini]NGO07825.1 hypothetical protein [Streptomyces scabichelini]